MNILSIPVIAAQSVAPLITFGIYTLAVLGIAVLSNQLLKKKSFLSEYFLGSRSLGVWAFALTFAATSASGGSFTGFPSKIYTHGWILALWIGSYMVVPICTMGLLGKRINHVARISGAITIPDVIRDRFGSPKLGLLAVGLIVFFMAFNLVAQFKAGSLILQMLLEDVEPFHRAGTKLQLGLSDMEFFSGVEGEYLLCLLAFGIAVIIYTTYGGFHAVVWTDVLQGVVMGIGVMVLLPLTLYHVGGLDTATRQLAEMTPPVRRMGTVHLSRPVSKEYGLSTRDWIELPAQDGGQSRVFRVAEKEKYVLKRGKLRADGIVLLEITTPSEIDRILDNKTSERITRGLSVSNLTTDEDQFGTATIIRRSGNVKPPEVSKSRSIPRGTIVRTVESDGESARWFRVVRATEIENGKDSVDDVKVIEVEQSESEEEFRVTEISVGSGVAAWGHETPGVYVSGPGPDPNNADGFLPLSLAISFFFMWAISGSGQPHNMVRLMAFNSSTTLRRSIFTVAVYYTAIYIPLVVIFTCARVLMPGLEVESDRIMPAMAVYVTQRAGVAWLAGLLVAAPFAAVMSTVDSFLLMISSAIVRDIYQRNLNPQASERLVKRLSYLFTLIVGTVAMFGAVNPPEFLQDIIVYVGSGLAACFLGPMVFALYWPRSNVYGTVSGMLAGFSAHLCMYLMGIFVNGSFFRPYRLFDFDPIIIGLCISFTTVLIVTRLTPPPPKELVRKYFYKS